MLHASLSSAFITLSSISRCVVHDGGGGGVGAAEINGESEGMAYDEPFASWSHVGVAGGVELGSEVSKSGDKSTCALRHRSAVVVVVASIF